MNSLLDTDDPDSYSAQVTTLLETFLREVTPGNVIAVEQEFRAPIFSDATGEILDVDLVGRIDLIESDVYPPNPGWYCKTCPVSYNCVLSDSCKFGEFTELA